jgi:hypothetical protein
MTQWCGAATLLASSCNEYLLHLSGEKRCILHDCVDRGVAARAAAEDYIKSYPIAVRAHVQVRAENATVRVTTADSPKVAFDVTYDPRDWSGQTPPISSHQSSDSVTLTVIPERHERWDWDFWNWGHGRQRLNVEVRMPKNADLQLETSNGQIQAEQLSGTMDIGSSNGAIALETLQGTLKVHTSNGRIQVTGRFDSLDISSSNGAVTVQGFQSRSRLAGTLNGGGPELFISTSNGSMWVRGI